MKLPLLLAFCLLPSAFCLAASPLGTAFQYQGRLGVGTNATQGIYDLRFTIYDAASGGLALGSPYATNGVAVSNGLFAVSLDCGSGVFNGDARWLAIEVRTNGAGSFTPLLPRQPLTPTPYALHAPTAGTAAVANSTAANAVNSASLQANSVTTGKVADGAITDAKVNASGLSGDKIVGGDLQARRLKVGQNHTLTGDLATIAGGNGNTASAYRAVVGGGEANAALNHATTVSGGDFNTASGTRSTVSGGFTNKATDYGTTVGGGDQNHATAGRATVSGGLQNIASGGAATVGGGRENVARGDESSVGGGGANTASGPRSTVSGGYGNAAPGYAAAVGGGDYNLASGERATVAGGYQNAIETNAHASTIAGGDKNAVLASADHATIAGGAENTNASIAAIVGGGYRNTIQSNAWGATIAGGAQNSIARDASFAAISGGGGNTNFSPYAAIPGGWLNVAAGFASFAAGQRAQALHDGSFVWADGTLADFPSTAVNQFAVRANGGVRLETGGAGLTVDGQSVFGTSGGTHFLGTTDSQPLELRANNQPGLQLKPDGDVVIDPGDLNTSRGLRPGLTFGSWSGEGIASKRSAGGNGYGLDFYTFGIPRLSIAQNGNVGIGTTGPQTTLEVAGQALVRGPSFSTAGDSAELSLGDANHSIRSVWGSGVRISTFQVPDAITLLQGSGNVGIGTTNPATKLEVQGGPIKATGGFILETRTSDPPSPARGQIWLRTDL